MDLGIAGRKALITGAAGGLGHAIATDLAAAGVELILTGLKTDELEPVTRDLGDLVLRTIAADLTDNDDLARLADEANGDGAVDIVVHAAGLTGAKGEPLSMTDDDWREAWDIDFMSAVRLARTFVPSMKSAGWGRVVFVTSENATQPYVDEMVYNVAKAAVATFTKGLGQSCASSGVLVNAVAPAFIETGMTDEMMAKRAEEQGVSVDEAINSFLEEERPDLALGRRGQPDEVAAVVALLCSDRATFTVGSNWRVDGGSVMSVDL